MAENLSKLLPDLDYGRKGAMRDVGMDGKPKVEEPPPPPPPPTFSEEELNLARDIAYEEGRQKGFDEGRDAAGRVTGEALAKMAQHMDMLAGVQAAANHQVLEDAVRLAQTMIRRYLPALAKRHAFDEVADMMRELVPHLLDEPRIIVRVAADIEETVRGHLEDVARSHGFEGRVVVHGDARMGNSDCKIEWADGGAERDLDRAVSELDAVLARTLAEGGAAQE